MLKRSIAMLLVVLLIAVSFVGCGNENNENTENNTNTGTETNDMYKDNKIGMVTDMGTIDDKSFNQGTWEGVLMAEEAFGLQTKYLKPAGFTTDDYLTEIGNLIDAGYEVIVTPGFKFEEAIFKAQVEYPEVKFILIDGMPNNADWSAGSPEYLVADNTVSVFFTEQESGFLAGVAGALESKTGKLGFIGGMEIPPVQKFGWGFVAGVAYANTTYGTTAEVVDYIYQGTFDQVDAGQQLAASMYDKGIDIIFAAAGGVGIGAINEAKTRKAAGEDVFVIGVDSDQYDQGLLEDGTSAILTSALKRVDNATYEMIKDFLEGNFKGGQSIVLDAKNGGVSLPEVNPNLDAETVAKTDESLDMLVDGTVIVPDTTEALDAFLAEQGYTTPAGVMY